MTRDDPIGSLLSQRPPAYDAATIAALAWDAFGLQGQLSPLTSERDQNSLLRNHTGCGFVIKIANASEPPEMTAFQVQALLHLEHAAPELAVPRMIPARAGGHIVPLASGGSVRVLTYLEGVPLYQTSRSQAQRGALGAALANVTRGLHGFDHPAADHVLLWDIKQAHRLAPLLHTIADPALRARATAFVARFDQDLAPRLAHLPTQVVHADLNPHNVLVSARDPALVAGILDFGDMVKTPRICDVAVAAAYLVDSAAPLDSIGAFISGYHAVLPLTQAELDCLLDLITARMITTLAITSWRAARQPENASYILRNFASAVNGIAALDSIPAARLADLFHTLAERTPR